MLGAPVVEYTGGMGQRRQAISTPQFGRAAVDAPIMCPRYRCLHALYRPASPGACLVYFAIPDSYTDGPGIRTGLVSADRHDHPYLPAGPLGSR